MRSRFVQRLGLAFAVVAGATAAGYITVSATADSGAVDEIAFVADEADNVSLVNPIEGEPRQVFSGQVAAANSSEVSTVRRDGVSIQIRRELTGEICWTAVFIDATYGGCDDMSVIRTGLAFGQFYNHGRGVDLIGVVPDDVDYVLVNGGRVNIEDNVWHYLAGEQSEHLDVVIGSDDGHVVSL